MRQAVHQQGDRRLHVRRRAAVKEARHLAVGSDAVDGTALARAEVAGVQHPVLVGGDGPEQPRRVRERLGGGEDGRLALGVDAPDTVLVGDKEPLLKGDEGLRIVEAGSERDRLAGAPPGPHP